jgi:hypothetical protein
MVSWDTLHVYVPNCYGDVKSGKTGTLLDISIMFVLRHTET